MNIIKRKRTLNAILAIGFLVALGVGMLSFSLPLLSLDAKISGAWLGTGFAGYFLARLLSGPLGGMWADRFGPRLPLLLASGGGVLLPLIYFLSPAVSTLFVLQGFMGIVSGLMRPIGLAVLGGNAGPDDRTRWYRLHVLAFNSALFAGPLIGGFIYLKGDVMPVLVGLMCCMAFAFAIVFVGIPNEVTSRRDENSNQTRMWDDGPGFFGLLSAIFGRSLGIGLTIAFYPVLLAVKCGYDGLLIGLLVSLSGLATCAGIPLGPLLKQRFKVDLALFGLLLSAVGVFCIGGSIHFWQFALAGIVVGLGAALSIPETMALASGYSRNLGKVFGAAQVVTGVGFMVGPVLGGLMIQYTHEVGLVFMQAGLVGCISLVPWAIRRSKGVFVLLVSILLTVVMGLQTNAFDSADDGLYRYTDVAMGTVVNLTLEAGSRKAADDSARKVFEFMRSVQRDLDYRDPQGSIGRINAGSGAFFVRPTQRAYDLLNRTIEFSEASGGVFDPTIGALTTSPLYYALDETVAHSKKHLVDYRRVIFDGINKRVRLAEQGMALDLGGIAKGAIIDAAVNILKKLGIKAGIVEAGGDFYCFGERDWSVGIRLPRSDDVHTTITVREKGVCGSGDYEQFVQFERDGETNLRHHIIDPKDMEPAAVSSGVTVIAQSAELADAMATTLFIMGPSAGDRFIQKKFPDVSAMWFMPDLAVVATGNFPKK